MAPEHDAWTRGFFTARRSCPGWDDFYEVIGVVAVVGDFSWDHFYRFESCSSTMVGQILVCHLLCCTPASLDCTLTHGFRPRGRLSKFPLSTQGVTKHNDATSSPSPTSHLISKYILPTMNPIPVSAQCCTRMVANSVKV